MVNLNKFKLVNNKPSLSESGLNGSNKVKGFKLDLYLSKAFFLSGSKLEGHLRVENKLHNLHFTNVKVELVGYEQLYNNKGKGYQVRRHPFINLKVNLPASNSMLSKVVEPNEEGYWPAEVGVFNIDFEVPLPLNLPSSTQPTEKLERPVAVNYLLSCSVQLSLPDGSLTSVKSFQYVHLIEKLFLTAQLKQELCDEMHSSEKFVPVRNDRQPTHFKLSIQSKLFLSGSQLLANLNVRNSFTRSFYKVRIALVEHCTFNNGSDLIVEPEMYEEGVEAALADRSTTLVGMDPATENNFYLSRNQGSDDVAVWKQVVAKRTVTGSLDPSDVDVQTQSRNFKLTLNLPSNCYSIEGPKFVHISYNLLVSVQFTMLQPKISLMVPIQLVAPAALDADPYRDFKSNLHWFEADEAPNLKFKVYERPNSESNCAEPTKLSETLVLRQFNGVRATLSELDDPIQSPSPNPNYPSVPVTPFSPTEADHTFKDARFAGEAITGIPRFNHLRCHSTLDVSPPKLKHRHHNSASYTDQDLFFPLAPQFKVEAPTVTMNLTPSLARRQPTSEADSSPKVRSHRRAYSEQLTGSAPFTDQYFFHADGKGGLPRFNLNWQSWDDPISTKPTKPIKGKHHKSSSLQALQTRASLETRSNPKSPFGCILEEDLPFTTEPELLVFTTCTQPEPIMPSELPKGAVNQLKVASGLHKSSLENLMDELPSPPPRTAPLFHSNPIPTPPTNQQQQLRRQRNFKKYHPEVLARKYSFPPKTKPTLTQSNSIPDDGYVTNEDI